MNKLIILGNGFDLAHKLPTRFDDFVLDYLKSIFNELLKKRDRRIDNSFGIFSLQRSNYNEREIKDVLKSTSLNEFREKSKLSPAAPKNLSILKVSLANAKTRNYAWVDFESDYHSELERFYEKWASSTCADAKEIKLESLKGFHHSWEDFLSLFRNYIKNKVLPKISECPSLPGFEDLINSLIESEEDFLTVLNFNYTNTIKKYKINVKDDHIFNIHGQADSEEAICLGYGDEDSEYVRNMQKSGEDEFFKYHKSSYYSGNYQRLMKIIDYHDYDVHIFGHSCGITDRTLLKELFDEERCKSIHYHYHTEDDYDEKSRRIKNRIMEDPKRGRRILIEFKKSIEHPQLNLST